MSEFNFKKLLKTFAELCPDFSCEPDFRRATVSHRFAEQVIFECSKEAQLAKFQGIDKTWRIMLDYQGKQGNIPAELIITAHVTRNPPVFQPFILNGCLKLTFKQASLLAVAKYCQIVPHLVLHNQIVLTPLAGAIFKSEDMPRLALSLREPLPKVVMAVISSCQTDGYYLEDSRCCITLRALQKTVVDRNKRISLLKKSMKLYQLHGKDFSIEEYIVYCRFVRSNSSSDKRRGPSPPQELDYLIKEIMDLDIPNETLSPSINNIKQKPIMRCAASFNGKTNKNITK